jgi:hypothetical protein
MYTSQTKGCFALLQQKLQHNNCHVRLFRMLKAPPVNGDELPASVPAAGTNQQHLPVTKPAPPKQTADAVLFDLKILLASST